MGKIKNINIRIDEERLEELKKRAKDAGLSQSDYIIMKTLDLVPVKINEIKEYTHTVKGRKYPLNRIVTKTILKPAPEIASTEGKE